MVEEEVGGARVEEHESGTVGQLAVAGLVVQGAVQGPAEVVGGEDVEATVAQVRRHRHLVEDALNDRPDPRLARRPARRLSAAGGRQGTDQPVQVVTLGIVELQGVRDAVQDAVGDIPDVASLEPGVVLDADASEQGDLLAAQPGHAPVGPVDRQTGLVGSELGATCGKELAQVALGGHAFTVRVMLECDRPCQYPSSQGLLRSHVRAFAGGRDHDDSNAARHAHGATRLRDSPGSPSRHPGHHPGQLLPHPARQLDHLHRAAVPHADGPNPGRQRPGQPRLPPPQSRSFH